MIFLAADSDKALPPQRLHWGPPPAAVVPGSETWSRATRHLIDSVKDDEGHRLPLQDDLWLAVYPPRGGSPWRAEIEGVAGIVGRGKTSEEAVNDWRRRFRAIVQRFLELRPFERLFAICKHHPSGTRTCGDWSGRGALKRSGFQPSRPQRLS